MNLLKKYKRWRVRRELRSLQRDISALYERAGRFSMTSEWTNDILLSGKEARKESLEKELEDDKL